MRQRYQHRRDKRLTFHQSVDSSEPALIKPASNQVRASHVPELNIRGWLVTGDERSPRSTGCTIAFF
jgi:hypothetical protein